MHTRTALHVATPNGAQSETTSSTHGVQKELRRRPQEIPVIGEGLRRPRRQRTTIRNWFRKIEESCVCTHAMAPARSGLGLALGGLLMLVNFTVNAQQLKNITHQSRTSSNGQLEVPEGGIVIGDTLPEAFWNLELKVVNHPRGNNTIRLRNYRNKLLVLDFWANYCKPCIESLAEWEVLQPQFSAEVEVLPIHIYYPPERALPFAQEKGWKLPIVVGNEVDTIINRLFFVQNKFGQVWIKDGKLLAIPKHEMANRNTIIRILTNHPVDIEMDDFLTYFDKRYSSNELE